MSPTALTVSCLLSVYTCTLRKLSVLSVPLMLRLRLRGRVNLPSARANGLAMSFRTARPVMVPVEYDSLVPSFLLGSCITASAMCSLVSVCCTSMSFR